MAKYGCPPITGGAGSNGSNGSNGTNGADGLLSIQRAKLTTAADGTVTWTYATPFGAGIVPAISAIVQAVSGTTDVNNVQIDGAPTNTQCKFRVTRTAVATVALIGLNILSVPASVGAQVIHAEAKAP